MHGYGKSDNLIVLKMFPNKRDDASYPAEGNEGRGLAKGNLLGRNKHRTQYRVRS